MPRKYVDPAERRARKAEVDDPEVVMEAAAVFLAVRSRSVHETRRRLLRLGYREELVGTVIERLVVMHYLDDDAFARAWVESRDRSRPRGESALRRELSLKGVERATIAAVLAERAEAPPDATTEGETRIERVVSIDVASADRAAADRLLEQRRAALSREPNHRKRRQKAYALLARNGFDPQVCQEASNAFASQDVATRG